METTIVGVVNLSPESPNRDTVVRGPAGAVETLALARELVAAGPDYIRAHDPELVVRALRDAGPE